MSLRCSLCRSPYLTQLLYPYNDSLTLAHAICCVQWADRAEGNHAATLPRGSIRHEWKND